MSNIERLKRGEPVPFSSLSDEEKKELGLPIEFTDQTFQSGEPHKWTEEDKAALQDALKEIFGK